jgi:hypothetical protein
MTYDDAVSCKETSSARPRLVMQEGGRPQVTCFCIFRLLISYISSSFTCFLSVGLIHVHSPAHAKVLSHLEGLKSTSSMCGCALWHIGRG